MLADSLTIARTYKVISERTGQMYIGEEIERRRTRHVGRVFFSRDDAERFIEGKPMRLDERPIRDRKEFESRCLAHGLDCLILSHGRSEPRLYLSRSRAAPDYYDSELAAAAALTKQESDISYLYRPKELSFIAPTKLSGTLFSYVSAAGPEGRRVYPVFTSLLRYREWPSRSKGEPMLLPFERLCDIAEGQILLIDPGALDLALPPENMERIRKKREKNA